MKQLLNDPEFIQEISLASRYKALKIAIQNRHFEIVSDLLDYHCKQNPHEISDPVTQLLLNILQKKQLQFDHLTALTFLKLDINDGLTQQALRNFVLYFVTRKDIQSEPKVSKGLLSLANPNTRYDKGMTALHHLISAGNQNLAIISQIIAWPKTDINICDNTGCTALHYAICSSKHDIFKELRKNNADINIIENNGRTLLHYLHFCKDNNFAMDLVNLFKHKINEQDYNGCTTLNMIIQTSKTPGVALVSPTLSYQCLPLVKMLLNNGADPAICDAKGCTVLHHAIFRGDIPLIEFLCEKYKHLITLSKNNYPLPLDYAKSLYKNEPGLRVVELLTRLNTPEKIVVIEQQANISGSGKRDPPPGAGGGHSRTGPASSSSSASNNPPPQKSSSGSSSDYPTTSTPHGNVMKQTSIIIIESEDVDLVKLWKESVALKRAQTKPVKREESVSQTISNLAKSGANRENKSAIPPILNPSDKNSDNIEKNSAGMRKK